MILQVKTQMSRHILWHLCFFIVKLFITYTHYFFIFSIGYHIIITKKLIIKSTELKQHRTKLVRKMTKNIQADFVQSHHA